jgi:hypothetical protein
MRDDHLVQEHTFLAHSYIVRFLVVFPAVISPDSCTLSATLEQPPLVAFVRAAPVMTGSAPVTARNMST